MVVNLYATLRQVAGVKSIDIPLPEGATARHLLEELVSLYPALEKELYNEEGKLHQHVHLFIKGRDITFLDDGLDTVLGPGDTAGLFPAVGGGSTS